MRGSALLASGVLASLAIVVASVPIACVGDDAATSPDGGAAGVDGGTDTGAQGDAAPDGADDAGDAAVVPGSVVWLRTIQGVQDDRARGVALDSTDNVYVGGTFGSATATIGTTTLTNTSNDGSDDGFVLKISPDGTLANSKVFGGAGGQTLDLAVDGAGSVFVKLFFTDPVTIGTTQLTPNADKKGDFYVAKLDPTLNYVAHAAAIGPGVQTAFGMTALPVGVALCGGNDGTATNFLGSDLVASTPGTADLFTARLFTGSDGRAPFVTKQADFACNLTSDATGRVVVGGSFRAAVNFGLGNLNPLNTNNVDPNDFLVSFSSTAQAQWQMQFAADPGASGFVVRALKMTPAGELYGAGGFTGRWQGGLGPVSSTGGTQSVMYKLSAAGTPIWSQLKVVPINFGFNGLATDKNGRLYTCGWLPVSADLGKGLVTVKQGGEGVFAVYKPTGDLDFAVTLGGADCMQIAVASNGDAILAGAFAGTLELGPTPVTTLGGRDGFVVRLRAP